MGFYGNITNTSNTTFSFDRIYPNRLAMDTNANNDGIFIGRYVLVEYDQDAAYPIIYTDGNKFYSSPNKEKVTRIKFETSDGFFMNEIGQVQDIETDNNGNLIKVNSIEFYQCIGEDSEGYAIFKLFTSVNTDNKYIQNFAIDEKEFGNSTFKGYDSTVWVKTSENKDGKLITKYVNIADLNSVVPTFDLETDAPTMTPITPHFDADSTNVYYKLHTQPQWGLRVAEQEEENSDGVTTWTKTTYDPTTHTTITTTINGVQAAINFNGPAFSPQINKNNINKHDNGNNYITILPTGRSGQTYYTHTNENGEKVYAEAPDIQEMRINLPAIGNMMSDAWDIIHGPKRDNARTDDNSSLQGRLDSFRFMADNQIPVKRANDGTLIGTNINGNNQCKVPEQGILGQSLTTSFDTDDAWIRTEINTNGLLDELGNEIGNNGISIHHTFHSKKDTETSANKNNSDGDGINKGIGNDLKLYTPIVDAAGHVVGKNTETVTLPYGYKTFTTEGLAPLNKGKENVEDLYTTINNQENGNNTSSTSAKASTSVANNTQDSIAIEPYNKWIQTQLNDEDNTLVIAHEIHAINTEKSSTDLNILKNNEIQNEIDIPDWDYDEAGHIKKKGEHTYTLPYGFKTINVSNNTTESDAPVQTDVKGETADNTQDSLTFEATNKWIKMAAVGENNENKIIFGHELSNIKIEDNEATNLNAAETKSDSIIIPDWSYDTAGHIISKQKHEYILPYGYQSFTDGTNTSTANSTQDEFKLVGDNWLQSIVSDNTITYNHIGPVTPETVTDKDNIENPEFGSTFTIEDWHFDSKGHMHTSGKTHTVQFPKGSIEHPEATSNNSEIITGLSFVPESGIISYQKDNSSTLKLTSDYKIDGISAGNIAGGDSLNVAFAKLEQQVLQEVDDRKTAITSAIAGIFDKNDDNEINKLAEIIEWINNNPSTATEMQAAIQDNADAISNEIDLAREQEGKIATDLTEEIGRATAAEQELQEQINTLQSWKKTTTENITNLNNTISQLLETINNLTDRIENLETSPQQPDNGGDEV